MDLDPHNSADLAAFFAKRFPHAAQRDALASEAHVRFREPPTDDPSVAWGGLLTRAQEQAALERLARCAARRMPSDENLQGVSAVLNGRAWPPAGRQSTTPTWLRQVGVMAALVVLAVSLLAWQVGGGRLLALAVFSLGFLLLNGIWPPAMLSIYLCFVAVVICILLGGVIGIWAASSDVVSQVIRPINDMLQTLPQFVFLIPALMLFQVGDFTALLAVVAYAIVPMIRYTEHGLRSVPRPLIEAGVSSGCSPWQMFWQIRLPLAQAQILIGINQTILYALGMLVIAALVGTTDLGQAIYIALGKANAGAGLVAGLGMALIAMTADRILQAVIRSGR